MASLRLLSSSVANFFSLSVASERLGLKLGASVETVGDAEGVKVGKTEGTMLGADEGSSIMGCQSSLEG